MKLDQTRYKAFWESPERYRLNYGLNIVPAKKSFYLDRGIAFHTTVDLASKFFNEQDIEEILTGAREYQGKYHAVEQKARESGVSLAQAFLSNNHLGQYKVLGSEQEFDVPIEGSPHSAVGRLDQVIEIDDKKWILEFKTANAKTSYSKKEKEWETDVQAGFELLGAKSLGYSVEGVLVQYVVDKNPPAVWEPLEVKRSNALLQRLKLTIHQTCETIEMYLGAFGVEQPWPHLDNWKCNGGYCEMASICQKQGVTIENCGAGWMKREEHLEILQ